MTWRKIAGAVAAALGLLAIAGTPGARAADIIVDGGTRFQTIEGFGSCLYLGASHPYDQPWFQDLYARDLGASIVRMELTPNVLGPMDRTPAPLGTDLEANVRRMDFRGAGGPTAMTMITALKSKKLDDLKLIGSLWTPPPWMKTGAKLLNGGGGSGGGHLKLDPDNLEQFGRYVAAYVKGVQEKTGMPFYAVSLQNELLFDEPYNSCIYTPEEYHAALRAVGRAFKQYGLSTKVEGPESVGPDGAWFTEQQMKFIQAAEADPETAGYLNIFSIHGYGGNGVDVISDSKALAQYRDLIKGYGRESWMTESSGEDPVWLKDDGKGGQAGALTVGKHIFQGLVYADYSAVVYWQTADGGAVSQYTLTNSDLSATPPPGKSLKYAAAKQFFRFIRPGAVRVAAAPQKPTLGVSAFVHDKNRTVTVVMVNTGATPETVRLRLTRTPPVGGFAVYRTSATESCVALPRLAARGGRAALSVPAQSIVTLYGTGT